ncbi:MAG: VOC family protein [Sphingobacteriales bacterium]|nr:MAG: VOC family protein [Sphingobacteriales bacterium]
MNTISNPVVYFEIPVTNVLRAIQFYRAVFGFEFFTENIDGNEMAHFPFIENGTGISGSLAKGETYKPTINGTLVYFGCNDIDLILNKAVENGGKVLYPKTSVGSIGFVAEFQDCEGNRIALYSKPLTDEV